MRVYMNMILSVYVCLIYLQRKPVSREDYDEYTSEEDSSEEDFDSQDEAGEQDLGMYKWQDVNSVKSLHHAMEA